MPNIWHLAHQKQSIMRCAICAKIMRHATIRSHFLKRMDENAIYVYYYFIHLSLSSRLKYKSIFTFSHSFSASPSPLSHALFFSLLLYSLPIHESWATTDFLSIISQILPSLIYEIRFTDFFSQLFSPFFLSLLSVLWSDTLNRFSSSQSRQFAVQSKPSSISSLPSHKFHHHWSIKSPSPVFSPPFFTLSSLFYDLIHRISLVHFRVVDSQFNLDIADSILVSPIL